MIERQHIICFGFAEWDNPYKTNQHHLMLRFSAFNSVLFIESLGLRQPSLQKKDVRRMAARIVKWLRGVRKVSETLYVFSPLVIPLHKYASVRKFNRCFLRWQLSRVVKSLKFSRPIVWSYVPNAVEYLGLFDQKLSVYHCVDELSANPRIPRIVGAMEQELLKKADIVFTTAKNLYESKKQFNARTYYMPNVADFDHFNRGFSELELPSDMRRKPVTLGFIGAISGYKLDFDLLALLASKHPAWMIKLIGVTGEGEKATDLTLLRKYSNIHLLGGKPYRELPEFLRGFDVCLLPNILNEYTKNMFPMKFFEYLAAGKAVVSTNLDALSKYSDYCYLSRTREEFEQNILRAIREDAPPLQRKRIACAKLHTWEKRIEEMSTVIEGVLSEKMHGRGADNAR
ncbi:MAG: glycosyltransferase [Elusimicrobiota bacterium]